MRLRPTAASLFCNSSTWLFATMLLVSLTQRRLTSALAFPLSRLYGWDAPKVSFFNGCGHLAMLLSSSSVHSPSRRRSDKHPLSFTTRVSPLRAADSPSTQSKSSRRLYPRTRHHDHRGEILHRADRVLSQRTGNSRKESFQLLKGKRVFTYDPTKEDAAERTYLAVPGPSAKITMEAPLIIDRTHVVPMPPPLLCVYHKPKWQLSVRRDPLGRSCLDAVCPDMHPVGRLDYDSSGLLLFSSDGKLTQTLLHPKHNIEKEYVAVVSGTVQADSLTEQLRAGVATSDGIYSADVVSIESIPHSDVAPLLADIRANLPPEYLNRTHDLQARGHLDIFDAETLTTVRLVVREGKHRMVRRILANVGHPVVSLHRHRLGEISLHTGESADDRLPEGSIRLLTPAELKWAKHQAKGSRKTKKRGNGSKPLTQTGERCETL